MRGATPDTLSLAASRLYEQVGHLDQQDDGGNWPLAVVCAAMTRPMDDVYELLMGGETAFAPAFDPELAGEVLEPDFAAALLGWAGQFVGVTDREDLPTAGRVFRVQETSGARRGSPLGLTNAARQRLVGPDGTPATATVYLVERVSGSPYRLDIATLTTETPDAAGTRRDITEAMPAGRQWTYATVGPHSVIALESGYRRTIGSLEAAYSTIAALEAA